MTQKRDTAALQEVLAPLTIEPEEFAAAPGVKKMAAAFDTEVSRLLRRRRTPLTLYLENSVLEISTTHRNDNDGWGYGPPSAWNEAEHIVEISQTKPAPSYSEVQLGQYLSFIAWQRYGDNAETTRRRDVQVKFGFETLVPLLPQEPVLSEAFGLALPSRRKEKPYKIERPEGYLAKGAKAAPIFHIGLTIVQALDPQTVRTLRKKR